MTMSIESRLRALEATRQETQRTGSASDVWALAINAANAGTATMQQYRLLGEEYVDRWRDDDAGGTGAYLAKAHVTASTMTWRSAMAYPPDVALPASVQSQISMLRRAATLSPEDTRRQLRRQPFLGSAGAPQRRLNAAGDLLILGDLHGLGLRRHVWRIQEGIWVLSDLATEASHRGFFKYAREADSFLGLRYEVARAVDSGRLGLPSRNSVITYAQLERASRQSGWRTDPGPPSWSDQVTSGQPSDDLVCKDLEFGVHRLDCAEWRAF